VKRDGISLSYLFSAFTHSHLLSLSLSIRLSSIIHSLHRSLLYSPSFISLSLHLLLYSSVFLLQTLLTTMQFPAICVPVVKVLLCPFASIAMGVRRTCRYLYNCDWSLKKAGHFIGFLLFLRVLLFGWFPGILGDKETTDIHSCICCYSCSPVL